MCSQLGITSARKNPFLDSHICLYSPNNLLLLNNMQKVACENDETHRVLKIHGEFVLSPP